MYICDLIYAKRFLIGIPYFVSEVHIVFGNYQYFLIVDPSVCVLHIYFVNKYIFRRVHANHGKACKMNNERKLSVC